MVSTAWNVVSEKFICTIDIAAHGSYSHYQNQYTLMRIILVLKNVVVMDNLKWAEPTYKIWTIF